MRFIPIVSYHNWCELQNLNGPIIRVLSYKLFQRIDFKILSSSHFLIMFMFNTKFHQAYNSFFLIYQYLRKNKKRARADDSIFTNRNLCQ